MRSWAHSSPYSLAAAFGMVALNTVLFPKGIGNGGQRNAAAIKPEISECQMHFARWMDSASVLDAPPNHVAATSMQMLARIKNQK